MLKKCRKCGKFFKTDNVRRLYCRPVCRRKFQDERLMRERHEKRFVLLDQKKRKPPYQAEMNIDFDFGLGGFDPLPTGLF